MKHKHLFVLIIAAFTAFLYPPASGSESSVSNIAQDFLLLEDLKATNPSPATITGEPELYFGTGTLAPHRAVIMENISISDVFFDSRDNRKGPDSAKGFFFIKGELVPIDF